VALQLLNRVEEVEVQDPSPQPRNEEAEGQVPSSKPDEAEGHVTLLKPAAKMTSEERYALSIRQIAESQACRAAQKGPHA
jgi:hypothetical protein